MFLGGSKDSALTKQMLQLICMFAGCRGHVVGLVIHWFIETTKIKVFKNLVLVPLWDFQKNMSHPGMACIQGSHRLEKYLNLEGFLEKSLKIKSAMKNTGKSLKGLEKSLNFTIYSSIQRCL